MFINYRYFIIIPVVVLFCTAPIHQNKALDYKNIDLSYDRSLCGRSPLPFWFNLTPPEVEALENVKKAREGNPEFLLSLALIASGNVRTTEDFSRYFTKVIQFANAIRPIVENERDYRKKGSLLYTYMRKGFFADDSISELAGYRFGQSRLSVLLENGTYNCISSAMLFCILGRWFDMQVDGVLMKGHAFVQVTTPDGEVVEVETTSRDGFGWNHNEEFYRRKSSRWLNVRDIAHQTYEDYTQRRIVKPYQLITHNMKNQHTDFSRMNVEDVHRLIECRAFIDDTNMQYQKDLITTYRIELTDLWKKRDGAALRRFHRTVASRITLILSRCEDDSTVVSSVKGLYRQLLSVSEREIDSLLVPDSCIGADSIYGMFTEVVKDIFRLFPDDAVLYGITKALSEGVIVKLTNRITDLIEKKQFVSALSHYTGAESFADAQVELFPEDKDVLLQYDYFLENKQILLFAEKNVGDFITFSRQYIEAILQHKTMESEVLLKNALYNTFTYIKYCTERKAFEKTEQLVDIVSEFTATDLQFARNIQWALGEIFRFHFDNADWSEAVRIIKKQIAVDVNKTFYTVNSDNLQICYLSWASQYYNDGDVPKAREILNRCVNDSSVIGDECSSKLHQLENDRTK